MNTKTPRFFIHAKGKAAHQVEPINDSVVNRLDTIVPNKRMSFAAKNVGVFKYRNMMQNTKVEIDDSVLELYDVVEKQYRYSINFYDNESNASYIKSIIIERFTDELDYPLEVICDMLVKHLFHRKQSKRKSVFWLCFGEIVLLNLNSNLPKGSKQCKKCGTRFITDTAQKKLCANCATYQPMVVKTIACVDCGSEVEVSSKNTKTLRCSDCQLTHRRRVRARTSQ